MVHTNSTLHPKTPQQELWAYLKSDEQQRNVASYLRNLKRQAQEDICYGLIAYLQHGLKRQFSDEWLNRHYLGLVNYLQAEIAEGRL